MHALVPAEIEKGFIDRQRLDQGRQRLHRVAHFAANPDIFRHVGPDHDGRGHSASALNIGIAERTPKVRAM